MAIEGTYLNIIKANFDKPTANIIFNSEKLKAFLLNSGTTQDAHSHHFYSTYYWLPSHSNQRQVKEIKGIQIGVEEVKLSLFADDMILYIENPKDFTQIY